MYTDSRANANFFFFCSADYVIALKGNQKYLFEEVTEYFDDALENNFKDFDYVCFKETEKDHGRIESRRNF